MLHKDPVNLVPLSGHNKGNRACQHLPRHLQQASFSTHAPQSFQLLFKFQLNYRKISHSQNRNVDIQLIEEHSPPQISISDEDKEKFNMTAILHRTHCLYGSSVCILTVFTPGHLDLAYLSAPQNTQTFLKPRPSWEVV